MGQTTTGDCSVAARQAAPSRQRPEGQRETRTPGDKSQDAAAHCRCTQHAGSIGRRDHNTDSGSLVAVACGTAVLIDKLVLMLQPSGDRDVVCMRPCWLRRFPKEHPITERPRLRAIDVFLFYLHNICPIGPPLGAMKMNSKTGFH
jgi:hypothetical protein